MQGFSHLNPQGLHLHVHVALRRRCILGLTPPKTIVTGFQEMETNPEQIFTSINFCLVLTRCSGDTEGLCYVRLPVL